MRITFDRLQSLCACRGIVCERTRGKIELTTPNGGTTAECDTVAEAYDTLNSDTTFSTLPILLRTRINADPPPAQPVKKFRSYRAHFIGWTNTKPSRVVITDMQTGERATISKDGTTEQTALAYLQQCRVTIDGTAYEDKTGDTIFLSSGPYVNIRTPLNRAA